MDNPLTPNKKDPETMKHVMKPLAAIALACLLPALGHAESVELQLNTGNTAWVLTATALVLMMTIPGLALFYGGLTRKTNLLNTLAMCFGTTMIVTFTWIIAGYSLSFFGGEGELVPGLVGGLDRVLLKGMTLTSAYTLANSIPEAVFMMYQMTFAIITPALIVGAVVERVKFSTMLVFVGLWSLLVYAPIAHMVWGGGKLGVAGVLDYAGGNVVHINAGVAALVLCLMLGKRKGWSMTAKGFEPNNLALSIVGASLLWVGWFGFNAGSALAADGRAGLAMSATHLATASAAIFWMLCEWGIKGKPSTFGMITGAVAGLVAITPAAGFVDGAGALVIGMIGGIVAFFGCNALKARFGYDDSLDVVGVHGLAGLVGTVLTGVFAVSAIGGTSGLLEGNPGQVLVQLKGVAVVILWSAVGTYVIAKALDLTMGLRVSAADEKAGLDLAAHGESVE